MNRSGARTARGGFSLIELLIVVAIMATLAGGTVLAFGDTLGNAREGTRRHNRQTIRRAIDDYRADRGRFPGTLDELVQGRYLREVPVDPVTRSADSWVLVPSEPGRGDVWDVRWPEGSAR